VQHIVLGKLRHRRLEALIVGEAAQNDIDHGCVLDTRPRAEHLLIGRFVEASRAEVGMPGHHVEKIGGAKRDREQAN
jgi:hypothetical protein